MRSFKRAVIVTLLFALCFGAGFTAVAEVYFNTNSYYYQDYDTREALAGEIDTLICGGIGGGAQAALANAGIKLYGGASGDADAAVEALLAGELAYDPNARCDHHDHHGEGHDCGSHSCGSHSCH